jgi:hypothetical protein
MHGDFVKVPPRYRLLGPHCRPYRWTRAEWRWVLRQHSQLPALVAAVVLGGGSSGAR